MSGEQGLSDGAKIAMMLGVAAIVILGGSALITQSRGPQAPPAQPTTSPDTEAPASEAPAEAAPSTESTTSTRSTPQPAPAGPTHIRVTDDVVVAGAKRVGINLGAPEPYGASNYLKNIIHNPGFEPGVFRSMMHADDGATGERVPRAFWSREWDVEEWGIGQPEDFWNGAAIEFVYGAARGREGTVRDYAHEGDQHVFYVTPGGAAPDRWDVFIVRKEFPGLPAGNAMNPALGSADTRPGSPGVQSLHLQNPGGDGASDWRYYMDSTYRDGDRSAGKLYIVEGAWELRFWAKGGADGDSLSASFWREGQSAFVEETVPLTADWKEYTFTFDVPPGADAADGYTEDSRPILTFQFTLWDEGAEAWIDDVYLGRRDHENPTVFSGELVEALARLKPGVIRNWSGQLGSPLDNELAEPYARKTYEHNPRGRTAGSYHYSLHEFLQLCEMLDAEPWYVVPPTFTEAECAHLIAYLAAPADSGGPYAAKRAALGQAAPWTDVFDTIHLEYGNEMWGDATPSDPFYGGSAMGGERLGQMASDRFGTMKASPYFAADTFNCIIGGQAFWPGRQEEIDRNATHHDTIAIAPYFGGLETFDSTDEIYPPLFAYPEFASSRGVVHGAVEALRSTGKGTGLAVYEINYHTTDGLAPENIRNPFVAGASGAVALPLHTLVFQRDLGVRTQCVFSLLQYSFAIGDQGHVRLWGVYRDLFATGRIRPTGLGMALVNNAIQGDMVATVHGGANPHWTQSAINSIDDPIDVPYLYSFAFKDGADRSLVLFNLHLTDALPVTLDLPGAAGGLAMERIHTGSIDAWNEDGENVSIESVTIAADALGEAVPLPPHSVTTLTWREP